MPGLPSVAEAVYFYHVLTTLFRIRVGHYLGYERTSVVDPVWNLDRLPIHERFRDRRHPTSLHMYLLEPIYSSTSKSRILLS